MNNLCLLFVIVSVTAILAVPRRWVLLPFLACACYTTYGQGVDLGPLTFYIVRLLLLAGFVRGVTRGERLAGGLNSLDYLVFAWAGAAVVSSVGHEEPASALIFRLGLVYDYGGVYFLSRVFLGSMDEVIFVLRILAILLVALALEMVSEKLTGRNHFAVFGGVSAECYVRGDKIRAQGPFMHPILAGTVGAVCLPMMMGLWSHYRKAAIVGVLASAGMVISSGSSGPMMSAIFAVVALCFWRYRKLMWTFRWMAVCCYVILDILMKVPPYYLLARLDLAGGSTGWHRAELINAAIRHIGEWWFLGTDYTRHWMPNAGGWNPNHCDTTNQYILMGVWGGLPLMLLFIAIVALGFAYVGRIIRASEGSESDQNFLIWALGASLFANAATCVSVAFFDQSFLFLYFVLGSIGSLRFVAVETVEIEESAAGWWSEKSTAQPMQS